MVSPWQHANSSEFDHTNIGIILFLLCHLTKKKRGELRKKKFLLLLISFFSFIVGKFDYIFQESLRKFLRFEFLLFTSE